MPGELWTTSPFQRLCLGCRFRVCARHHFCIQSLHFFAFLCIRLCISLHPHFFSRISRISRFYLPAFCIAHIRGSESLRISRFNSLVFVVISLN